MEDNYKVDKNRRKIVIKIDDKEIEVEGVTFDVTEKLLALEELRKDRKN
jgi:hypothetical protein